MPVSLAPTTVIVPLSLQVFNRSPRHVIGRIEDCTSGLDTYVGLCLVTDRGEEVFSHPTLFRDELFAAKTGGWVRVAPEVGMVRPNLVMQPWDRQGDVLGGPKRREAPPVEIAQTSIDAVLEFAAFIAGMTCPQDDCRGASGRPLDLRRSVFFLNGPGLYREAYCSRCFRQAVLQDPALADRIIVDGRRLPPRASVTILAPA